MSNHTPGRLTMQQQNDLSDDIHTLEGLIHDEEEAGRDCLVDKSELHRLTAIRAAHVASY